MLQMVRTLAQFSIALEEMQENGESASDEGRQEQEGGEELMDRDEAERVGNPNGNGLGAVSPQHHGEVDQCVCVSVVEGYSPLNAHPCSIPLSPPTCIFCHSVRLSHWQRLE